MDFLAQNLACKPFQSFLEWLKIYTLFAYHMIFVVIFLELLAKIFPSKSPNLNK